MKRYEQLARHMADEIRAGHLATGARMPSLRQVIAQHRVSQSTATRAYHLLEQWGLVRAEERSGYFAASLAGDDARNVRRASSVASAAVDISDLVFPVLDAAKRPGIVMHCSSFSKTLAPGYRIGWTSAGRYADRVRRLKLMTTLSASIPVQAGIADYLEHGGYDRHLKKIRAALQARQHAMDDALRRWLPRGTQWTLPDGGYFLWLEFPEPVDAMALHRLAIERGVSLAPGPVFSASHAFQHCIRLNYGYPWSARVDEAVRTLGELLADPAVRAVSRPRR